MLIDYKRFRDEILKGIQLKTLQRAESKERKLRLVENLTRKIVESSRYKKSEAKFASSDSHYQAIPEGETSSLITERKKLNLLNDRKTKLSQYLLGTKYSSS